MTKDPCQISGYNCNKIGHITKYCYNREKSNFITNKPGRDPYKHQKRPSSSPNSKVMRRRVKYHSPRIYKVFSS